MEISGPSSRISSKFPVPRLTYDLGLVLFFCSFLALRSRDSVTRIMKITDFDIRDEKELFGG